MQVGQLRYDDLQQAVRPKVVVVAVITNQRGEYLLTKRHIAPFRDKYKFLRGRLTWGEDAFSCARRKLFISNNIQVEPVYRGIANVRIATIETVVTHDCCYVFSATVPNNTTATPYDPQYEYEWVNIQKMTQVEFVPGVRELADIVKDETGFYRELHYICKDLV